MDLLLEDICKLDWAKSIKEDAMTVVHFITNHHKSLALFRTQSKEHSKDLQLKKPGELACVLKLKSSTSKALSISAAQL